MKEPILIEAIGVTEFFLNIALVEVQAFDAVLNQKLQQDPELSCKKVQAVLMHLEGNITILSVEALYKEELVKLYRSVLEMFKGMGLFPIISHVSSCQIPAMGLEIGKDTLGYSILKLQCLTDLESGSRIAESIFNSIFEPTETGQQPNKLSTLENMFDEN